VRWCKSRSHLPDPFELNPPPKGAEMKNVAYDIGEFGSFGHVRACKETALTLCGLA